LNWGKETDRFSRNRITLRHLRRAQQRSDRPWQSVISTATATWTRSTLALLELQDSTFFRGLPLDCSVRRSCSELATLRATRMSLRETLTATENSTSRLPLQMAIRFQSFSETETARSRPPWITLPGPSLEQWSLRTSTLMANPILPCRMRRRFRSSLEMATARSCRKSTIWRGYLRLPFPSVITTEMASWTLPLQIPGSVRTVCGWIRQHLARQRRWFVSKPSRFY
jgi:hypothetical protein